MDKAGTTEAPTIGQSAKLTLRKFELRSDGRVQVVGRFGAYGPTVEAHTKTEATTKILAFAFRAHNMTPRVRTRNGAWQVSYESLNGITVEAGVEGRKYAICLSGVSQWSDLDDTVANFDYYASDEYREAMRQ